MQNFCILIVTAYVIKVLQIFTVFPRAEFLRRTYFQHIENSYWHVKLTVKLLLSNKGFLYWTGLFVIWNSKILSEHSIGFEEYSLSQRKIVILEKPI